MTTKPQDHKAKADTNAQKQARLEEIDGHELLKPFSKVKGSDQLRLMSQLRGLGVLDSGESSTEDLDIDKLADLIDYVAEHFAVDTKTFEEFTTGKGGYDRALNLAIAYAGELGNDGASETS
jgi:hypothetical protein